MRKQKISLLTKLSLIFLIISLCALATVSADTVSTLKKPDITDSVKPTSTLDITSQSGFDSIHMNSDLTVSFVQKNPISSNSNNQNLNPGNVSAGKTYGYTVYVTNEGSVDSFPTSLFFTIVKKDPKTYDSQDLISDMISVPAVPAGTSTSIKANITYPKAINSKYLGPCELNVIVNKPMKSDEINNDNNIGTMKVNILELVILNMNPKNSTTISADLIKSKISQ